MSTIILSMPNFFLSLNDRSKNGQGHVQFQKTAFKNIKKYAIYLHKSSNLTKNKKKFM